MGKNTFLALVFIALTVFGASSKTNSRNLQNQIINVGGVLIKIPLIDSSFVEVGSENRKEMEILIPNTNKLLCAYVLAKELPLLFSGTDDKNHSSIYATIQVVKILESKDINSEDFEILVNYFRRNDIFKQDKIKEVENEMSRRLETHDLSKLEMGQPTPLGCFFSKKDLYGQGTLLAYEENGTTKVKTVLLLLIHVKTRYIMAFINSSYKGNETINWIRSVGEKWGDKILKVNQLQTIRK